MDERVHKLALPLFIVWPFGGFLLSLTNLRVWTSGLVFVLFCAVFGFSFAFENTSADSFRVAYVFQQFNFSSLKDIYLVYREGGSTDLYRFLIYGITKIFTNNPKVLYALFGTVFGLFLYLSLRLAVVEKGNKNDIYAFLLILFFFALNPIPAMNGARFNTAVWVFFYSTMNFLFMGNKRWAFGVLATPLIHFSFLFAISFVFLFYFFGRFFYSESKVTNWLFYCFVICFGLYWILGTNVINIGFLSDSNLFSSSVSKKIDLYTNDTITEMVDARRSSSVFLRVSGIFRNLMNIFIFIFLIRIRKIINIIGGHKNIHRLLAFIFLFLSFGYLASSIPSGSRFIALSNVFCLFLFIKMYRLLPNYLSNQILWGIPVFSFSIAFGIVYMSITLVDAKLWYGNLFWIIYEGLNFSKQLIL